MHLLIQRVTEARVTIAGETAGAIGHGLLVLVCAEPPDTEATASKAVARVLKLRIFSDEAGRMNRSVQDVGGGLLIVSQFTLAADTRQGNRPSFTGAAPAARGEARCLQFFVDGAVVIAAAPEEEGQDEEYRHKECRYCHDDFGFLRDVGLRHDDAPFSEVF